MPNITQEELDKLLNLEKICKGILDINIEPEHALREEMTLNGIQIILHNALNPIVLELDLLEE